MSELQINLTAADVLISAPVNLPKGGNPRRGDLRLHVVDVDVVLRWLQDLTVQSATRPHLRGVGEWQARAKADRYDVLALEAVHNGHSWTLSARLDGNGLGHVLYLGAEDAALHYEKLLWTVAASRT